MRSALGERFAEMRLKENIEALRLILQTHGAPRIWAGTLYFGDLDVGQSDIIDRLPLNDREYATIFCGTTRVATNVRLSNGSSAIGTSLARGPAYVSVIDGGITFRGEATLYERPILAIYEPIKIRREVVGMLFVGIDLNQAGRGAR